MSTFDARGLVGERIAAELVSLDSGPDAFPWPHYSTYEHQRLDDGRRDVTVTVYGTEPDEDLHERRLIVTDDELAQVLEVIDREWGRYLDSTRSPAEWDTYYDRRLRAAVNVKHHAEALAAAEDVDEVTRLLLDREMLTAVLECSPKAGRWGTHHYGQHRVRFTGADERPSTSNGARGFADVSYGAWAFAVADELARLLDTDVLDVLERANVTHVDELVATVEAGGLDELLASLVDDAPLVALLAARNLERVI